MSERSDYPPRDPELFYDLARERLATQLSVIDALDNKIISLVGFGSAVLGILAAVVALRASGDDDSLGTVELAFLAASGVAYAVVIWTGIRAYFARKVALGPDLLVIWRAMWRDDDDSLLKWQVANDYRDYYERNVGIQVQKSNALPRMLGAVITQSVLLVLALAWVAVA